MAAFSGGPYLLIEVEPSLGLVKTSALTSVKLWHCVCLYRESWFQSHHGADHGLHATPKSGEAVDVHCILAQAKKKNSVTPGMAQRHKHGEVSALVTMFNSCTRYMMKLADTQTQQKPPINTAAKRRKHVTWLHQMQKDHKNANKCERKRITT